MEIMLNPPRKRKHKATKGKKKSSRRRKHKSASRFCMPKRALRRAKSLKGLKRYVFHPGKVVCMPKSAISHSRSLKKLKHRYAGVKYGFARRKKSAGGGMVQGPLPFGPAPRARAPRAVRTPKSKGAKYTYMDILNLSPLEREMKGISSTCALPTSAGT